LLPGETADLPPERLLRLADLTVESRPGSALRLVGPEERRILPCFLSPLNAAFLPEVLRFLDLFGARPERSLPWPRTAERGDGWEVARRRMVDTVVLERRRWTIDAGGVPALEVGAAAFAALHSWRRRLGLPDQVYLWEKERTDELLGEVWKPQYLDFRSPSFVALLADALDRGSGPTAFVEALPRPEDFPLDPEEGPRAFEVVLDSLAVRPREGG
jgi:Lantibiotic dehydratase, N terminus